LKIKSTGKTPQEEDFIVKTDNQDNYYPSIRLGFAKSFCSFLINGDENNESQFLAELESNLK